MAKHPLRLRVQQRWLPLLPVLVRVIFCILVGCLAAHFLVDGLHLKEMGVLGQSSGADGFPNYAEIDHQDDLAIQAAPPARIAGDPVPPAFGWAILPENRPAYPIFHPPQT
jgi:hypothetical protein